MAAFLLFCMGSFSTVQAQPEARGVGLGGQIGNPSGVTLKIFTPARPFSWEFLAAWDLGDFFFLHGHGHFQEWLDPELDLGFFYGPGAFIGFRERRGEDEAVAGISVTGGANLFVRQLEFFAQLTPRLDVIPSTDGRLGGGFGLRYYF